MDYSNDSCILCQKTEVISLIELPVIGFIFSNFALVFAV